MKPKARGPGLVRSVKDGAKKWVTENREMIAFGAGRAVGMAVGFAGGTAGKMLNVVAPGAGIPIVFAASLAAKAVTTYADNVRHARNSLLELISRHSKDGRLFGMLIEKNSCLPV